jgi:hypothetical protein
MFWPFIAGAGEPINRILFNSPVFSSYVIPAGVTTISLEALGSGAQAGLGILDGGAGGGGAYSRTNNIAVTPGETIYFSGLGTVNGSDYWARVGTNSAPASTAQRGVLAKSANFGSGGAAASSVGDVRYSGGGGGSGFGTDTSGGGGAAAGPNGDGGGGGSGAGAISAAGHGGGGAPDGGGNGQNGTSTNGGDGGNPGGGTGASTNGGTGNSGTTGGGGAGRGGNGSGGAGGALTIYPKAYSNNNPSNVVPVQVGAGGGGAGAGTASPGAAGGPGASSGGDAQSGTTIGGAGWILITLNP